MSKPELFAKIELNESVIVLNNQTGEIEHEGLISKIFTKNNTYSRKSIYIEINGEEILLASSYYSGYSVYNADRFRLKLHQKVVSELADITAINTCFADGEMTHDEAKNIQLKIKELQALVDPVLKRANEKSVSKGRTSSASYLSMWGKKEQTESEIVEAFYQDAVFLVGNSFSSLVEERYKELTRNDNVLSIESGKPIKEDVKSLVNSK